MHCGEVCIWRKSRSRATDGKAWRVGVECDKSDKSDGTTAFDAFLAVQVLCCLHEDGLHHVESPAIFLVAVSSTALVEQFSCGTKFNIIRLLIRCLS